MDLSAERVALRFALVADVQYASWKEDFVKDKGRTLMYADALAKLTRMVASINSHNELVREGAVWDGSTPSPLNSADTSHPIAFLLQLGDLIDGHEGDAVRSETDLDAALEALDELRGTRVYHLVGNHCRSVPTAKLYPKLFGKLDYGDARGWYDFAPAARWRFIVLNGALICRGAIDHSDAGNCEASADDTTKRNPWDGELGSEQLDYFAQALETACVRDETVVVFCHYPVALKAARERHLLADASHALRLLDTFEHVLAWFAGHDHRGGYYQRGSVHHVTLPAMLEAPSGSTAFAWIDLSEDAQSLNVRGHGIVPPRTLYRTKLDGAKNESAHVSVP